MNPSQDEFSHLLRTWKIWFRLRRLVRGVVWGLILALACWMLIASAALYFSMLTRTEFLRLGAGTVIGLVAASGLLALLWPVNNRQVAHFFDRAFKLFNRTVTALELRLQPLDQVSPEAQVLVRQQHADTLEHARQVKPKPAFFVHFTRLQGLCLVVLIAANFALLLLGESPFLKAARQRQVQEEIAQAVEKIESLTAEVAADPALSSEQREQILQSLEQAQQELGSAETPEQAIAILSSTAEELESMSDAQALEQAEGLRQAGSQLQQSNEPGVPDPLADFAEHLAEGDFLAAAQDLQDIDPAQLTPEEAATLADQLESAAESLSAVDPELAESLQQAAEALRQGQAQAASQALDRASNQLSQASQQTADAQAAQQAAAQVAQGEEQLLQATGQGGQTAQGNQPGAGDQPGGGAGQGTSPGSEAQGNEAGEGPIASDNGPGDGGEEPYEQIFAPQRLGPGAGETVTLPPAGNAGGQITGMGEYTPGEENTSQVPYYSALPDYSEAYWQAYDSGTIPASMRELVRLYFSSLAPTNP